MTMLLVLTLFIGFVLGGLTIIAAEALGVLFLIRRLNRKVEQEEAKAASLQSSSGVNDDLNPSYISKQGVVWVLDAEKGPKTLLGDKSMREQKRKKEILEVSPVRKYAKINRQSLILTELDGSHTEIRLKGCIIAAVSATSLSSRKWAKKYPIKVEHKTSVIYHGSRTFYIYLETSWEKESWCKALRLASCDDKEKLKWFPNLNLEFHSYLTSLNTAYPSFMKPSMGLNAEALDKSIKIDGSSSKVRHFLKKLAKKASRSGLENMANLTLTSGREERRINDKSHSCQESVLGTSLLKSAPTGKAPNCSVEENMLRSLSSSSSSVHSGRKSHISVISDADSDDKIFGDEGTLCWNLLISRLFFDAKKNLDLKSSMQTRIQRMLSNMRIPSLIGEVTCTGLDPGALPPYIHGMRVLPSDMSEVWALEIDIEYAGGAVLDIETRLEVRELDLQEGIMDANLESSSVEEVTSDLLEGFEYFGKQLKLSVGRVDDTEQKDEVDPKMDGMKSSKNATCASRWKSILHSITKQVSQVPLSLGIRIASLRGTMRLHIKSPPSDQLWVGFTSMPDIDFNLESFIGEKKISSTHIALFLISKFKASIRETLVLPNCESVCIPWMLAEKDDWVPRKVAPFIWIKQEAAVDSNTVHEIPNSQPSEATSIIEASRETTSNCPEGKHDEGKKAPCLEQPIGESLDVCASSLGFTNQSTLNENLSEELKTPLLRNDEAQQTRQLSKEDNPESQSPSRSPSLSESGRMGTRARMLGLGKKMGEKLEEKRRHIEERGRNIVERMRGQENQQK